MSFGRTFYQRLSVRHFRNITTAELEPASRLNLIHGENGHGKTSLIEALYVLSTTQSFREKQLGLAIQEGHEQCTIEGETESFGLSRQLRARFSGRGRSFLIDGKQPKRRLDYALSTPVIAFVPADMSLCSGPSSLRRTLMDRVMLYLDPGGADARLDYQKAIKERQKILSISGPRARELDAYEEVAARFGARMAKGRAEVASRLLEALEPAFSKMAAPGLRCKAEYIPGGACDAEIFRKELFSRRERDHYRGSVSYGPSRDELSLIIDGRPARSHASQGQQRIVTLALKIAEVTCVSEVACTHPLLLLDDVSSELDPARTAAVFELLREAKNQIFVTTTRPELFDHVQLGAVERADFRVENGAVKSHSSG